MCCVYQEVSGTSPLGGVSGADRISKRDLLSLGKEIFISVSFPSSHWEHSSLFHLGGSCFGDELYGVTQEEVAAVQPPTGGTYLR